MAHRDFDSKSHSTLLSASLQNLELSRDPENGSPQQFGATNDDAINEFPSNLLSKENIDFHGAATGSSKAPVLSTSEVTSPYTAISVNGLESPIPDPNGLGWPGPSSSGLANIGKTVFFLIQRCSS